MLADRFLNIPIESIEDETLAPPFSYGSTGQGTLYCRWCGHTIRLVSSTKAGVSCSDCGQALALSLQSSISEDL